MKSSPEKVMSHTEGKVFPLFGIRVVKEFDYMRVVAERDELVKALRKTSLMGAAYYGLVNEHKLHQIFLDADAILARYPEKQLLRDHTEIKPTGELVKPWDGYPENKS